MGIRKDIDKEFSYPEPNPDQTKTLGESLGDLMKENGWSGADVRKLNDTGEVYMRALHELSS